MTTYTDTTAPVSDSDVLTEREVEASDVAALEAELADAEAFEQDMREWFRTATHTDPALWSN